MGTCRLLALLAASLGAACTVVPEVPVAAVKPVSARAGEAAQFAASARTASSSGNFTAAAKGYEDYLAALAKDKDRDHRYHHRTRGRECIHRHQIQGRGTI